MANYVITNYETAPQDTITKANDLLEIYLETKDSTSNPVVACGITKMGSMFVGWVLHQG